MGNTQDTMGTRMETIDTGYEMEWPIVPHPAQPNDNHQNVVTFTTSNDLHTNACRFFDEFFFVIVNVASVARRSASCCYISRKSRCRGDIVVVTMTNVRNTLKLVRCAVAFTRSLCLYTHRYSQCIHAIWVSFFFSLPFCCCRHLFAFVRRPVSLE